MKVTCDEFDPTVRISLEQHGDMVYVRAFTLDSDHAWSLLRFFITDDEKIAAEVIAGVGHDAIETNIDGEIAVYGGEE